MTLRVLGRSLLDIWHSVSVAPWAVSICVLEMLPSLLYIHINCMKNLIFDGPSCYVFSAILHFLCCIHTDYKSSEFFHELIHYMFSDDFCFLLCDRTDCRSSHFIFMN